MVNVSNSYISYTKKSLKSKGLNPQDYVTSFICNENKTTKQYSISSVVHPLYLFDNNVEKSKLKMSHPLLYRKGGCWFASDTISFMFLISKKITIGKNGEFKLIKASAEGKNSLVYFIGTCLKERVVNKKLSLKELALNLDLSKYKLNEIFKGRYGNMDLGNLIKISMEFEGHNNLNKRIVMFEKFAPKGEKQQFEYDYENGFDD